MMICDAHFSLIYLVLNAYTPQCHVAWQKGCFTYNFIPNVTQAGGGGYVLCDTLYEGVGQTPILA